MFMSSPPNSYTAILTSIVMGLGVGLWEVTGAMPYRSSPAVSLTCRDSWKTHAVHQAWERLSPGADPAALIPRKSVSLMSSQSRDFVTAA